METEIEYRIAERHARSLFGAGEGKAIGSDLRLIKLRSDDPRLNALAQRYSDYRGEGFLGWAIHRSFSSSEIKNARLHLLQIKARVLPTGEECGTAYDDNEMCPLCGVGRRQVSPLRLRLTNMPRKAEIAQTWGGEIVISARLVHLFIEAGVTGWGLGPVQRARQGEEEPFTLSSTEAGRRLLKAAEKSRIPYPSPEFYVWMNRAEQRRAFLEAVKDHESTKSARRRLPGGTSSEWYQFFVVSRPVEVSAITRFGWNPFDDDVEGRNRCPLGLRDHCVGLNLLSHVTLLADTWEGVDLVRSRESVGTRRGLFSPRPLLFVSARLRDLLVKNAVNGWASEVVQLQAKPIDGLPS